MSDIITASDPSRLPWEMTLAEIIDSAAERHPDKVFLRYDKYAVTYGEFQEATRRVAQTFSRLGVGRGDRVCLFLPNGREVLFIWMGLARLGAICVTVNTAYKQDETAYIINNSESKVLVTHETLLHVAQSAAAQCPSLEASILVSGGSDLPEGWLDFWDLMDSAPAEDPPGHTEVDPDDVAMLVYTSGTTGNPKGVMLTHSMFAASGQGFATWTESTPDERFFTCMPYFHANAQYYSTMGTLCLGATLTVVDRFSASRFWDQVRESESTVVNFIGMMMPVLLKQDPSPSDRDNNVRLFYGSPAMAPEMLEEFERRFGAAVLIGFGMTETCYGTIERLGEPHRQGSSGKPRWHPDSRFQNELRIVDDSGAAQPPGAPRRNNSAQSSSDAGVLAQPGTDRRVPSERMAPHRRPRLGGRRRPSVFCRPQEGRGAPQGGEHIVSTGGGHHQTASWGDGLRRHRRAVGVGRGRGQGLRGTSQIPPPPDYSAGNG